MPNQNPLVIGDIPFPQYSVTTSEIITQGLAIIKGNIYTKDVNGRLIVPISTSGVADLSLGVFQARDVAPAPVTQDTDTIQCLKTRSRILLKSGVVLVLGQEVELSSAGSVTAADTAMAAVEPHTKGFLGTVYKVYTVNTDGSSKQKSAIGDLVIIDLGVG
jgi:hypothetical protein